MRAQDQFRDSVPPLAKSVRLNNKGVGGNLAGKCSARPGLEGGLKGHNMNANYLSGKPFDMLRAKSSVERPRPIGRGASFCQ